jgi:hypothetical protein
MTQIRYYDSLNLLAGANEASAAIDAKKYASDLFRWCACKVLLGQDLGESGTWLQSHLANWRPTGKPNKDLVRWTYLIATEQLHGFSSTERVREALAYIKIRPDIDPADYQITNSVLSLSMLAKDKESIKRWRDHVLDLGARPESESYGFELLFLSSLAAFQNFEDLERAANIVARVTHDIMWAPPYYSAAPHICALGALAAEQGRDLRPMLTDRLQVLDQIVFGTSSKPRLEFEPPIFQLRRQGDQDVILEIEVRVHGEGQINTGAFPIDAITYKLPATIRAATSDVERIRSGNNTERRQLLGDALYTQQGTCRAMLILSPTITISRDDYAFLKKRWETAWEIVRHRMNTVVCKPDIAVKSEKIS